jgi:hypothetical protein
MVALSFPAATCCCHPWQWLVVASSVKQKQQRHHQQLANCSTILKMFIVHVQTTGTYFHLSTVNIIWIDFSSNVHTKDVANPLPPGEGDGEGKEGEGEVSKEKEEG